VDIVESSFQRFNVVPAVIPSCHNRGEEQVGLAERRTTTVYPHEDFENVRQVVFCDLKVADELFQTDTAVKRFKALADQPTLLFQGFLLIRRGDLFFKLVDNVIPKTT